MVNKLLYVTISMTEELPIQKLYINFILGNVNHTT